MKDTLVNIMLSTTCKGGAESEALFHMIGDKGGAQVDEERRPEVDVQEWSDESKYEGQFVNALKHGKGKYIWGNGEVIWFTWVTNLPPKYRVFAVLSLRFVM